MSEKTVQVGILDYPGAMQSAVMGLAELFSIADGICVAAEEPVRFVVRRLKPTELSELASAAGGSGLHVLIIPPAIEELDTLLSDPELREDLGPTLTRLHRQGAILCSACVGAFLLAETGLLDGRPATTHWGLAERFERQFANVKLDSGQILINDGDLITAGGLMSWLDLGLELVAQFSSSAIMRQLGKHLVVDTAPRQQRYYQSFVPRLDHGDKAVLKAQHYLQRHFAETVKISALAEHCYLSERTLLRRFVRVTGYKPQQYLQRLRIQKACDLIESSQDSLESIAAAVGYEDGSAFRKTFQKLMGLSPREFRRRFAGTISPPN